MFACKVRAEWIFLLKLKPRYPDRVPGRSGSPPCDGRCRPQNYPGCPAAAGAGTAGRPPRGGSVRAAVANRTPAPPGCRWRGKSFRSRVLSPKARARITPSTGRTDLPPGVYRLQVSDAATAEDVPLISAPERAFGGEFDRCWLLAVQLYGVRSARNWGMGDFTDLASLIELADHLGADGIGLNPLHALFDDRPGDCSPYSPNSRLFLNALYIDVEKLPEFQLDSEAATRWRQLRAAERRLCRRRRPEMAGAARGFCRLQGQSSGPPAGLRRIPRRARHLLSHFACFEVLRTNSASRGGNGRRSGGSRTMPDRRPARARTRAKSSSSNSRNGRRTGNWAPAADLARKLGMKVGLYLDVAVGVQADGFDAWNEQVAISRHSASARRPTRSTRPARPGALPASTPPG